jgi:hypothetical protein
VIPMNWANYLPGALTCHSDVLQPGGHPVCAEAAGSCARSCDHNQRSTTLRTPALPRLGVLNLARSEAFPIRGPTYSSGGPADQYYD